jgi:hypothetical protein
MKSFEEIKIKLVRAINESSDQNLIFKLWEIANSKENIAMVAEPQSIYNTENQ